MSVRHTQKLLSSQFFLLFVFSFTKKLLQEILYKYMKFIRVFESFVETIFHQFISIASDDDKFTSFFVAVENVHVCIFWLLHQKVVFDKTFCKTKQKKKRTHALKTIKLNRERKKNQANELQEFQKLQKKTNAFVVWNLEFHFEFF